MSCTVIVLCSPTKGLPVPSEIQNRLIQLLKAKALKHLDEPVQLASGEWSADFIDGKEALQDSADLMMACDAIAQVVREAGLEFDAVGGLTLGADALAVGIAISTDRRWFFVRKEPKARGTRRMIEGAQISAGDRVLLVDDVVTSGGSIITAYESVSETGAEVIAAVTLVDRSEVAASRFAELGVPYFPMATYATLGINPVGLASI